MKPLSEENESWVQDLKHHWPDAGEAPEVSLPTRRTPLVFPALTAAAAAIVLMAILILTPEPPAHPSTAPSIPNWPEFDPTLRSTRLFSIPNVRRTRPATKATTHRDDLQRLQSRLNRLKTKETWRTTP